MADPITLAIVGGATAAMSTYGQYQQQKSQRQAYKAQALSQQYAAQSQADLANYQATTAENNRRIVQAQNVVEESRMRREQRRRIGAQRAGLAESGVFGKSSFDILEESMINAEMDVLNTRAKALQEGADFTRQAEMKRYEGRVAQFQGRQASQMSMFKARQAGQQAKTTLLTAPINIGTSAAKSYVGAGGSF